ncbi:MAG TPA: monovalent cation/H+ antiporter subunit D family protein [Alphaproteobacteria bacterium]
MIGLNLPALQVVVPLFGAPLCTLIGRGARAWGFSLLVTWTAFALAIALMAKVAADGPISYMMGDWPAPWGIEYRVDFLNAFVALFVTGVAAAVIPFAYHSVAAEIPADRHRLFYTAYLLTFAGLLGMTVTGDAFNAFVFMEISSLSGYVLVSLGRDRRALFASYQYLVLGTIGATFFVIAIGLLYIATGTLNMADLAARIPALEGNLVVIAAYAFLLVGLSLKVALFPLHLWLPNAYTYAPSMVSALLAATATKVGIYLILRFMFGVFGVGFSVGAHPVTILLMPLALIAAVSGSLVAITQINVKRVLAYSSVAQIGYIVIGIAFATSTGLTGAVVHLFNHALMKGAMFLALGAVMLRVGGTRIEHLKGLGRRMPLTMAAFVAAGLSMIGVPGTVGFVSKWYLVLAALEAGWWPVAVVIIGTSILAIVYVWRVVEAAYFAEPDNPSDVAEAPWPMVAATWALAGACILFGLTTELTVGTARLAAGMLLGTAP